MPDILRLVFTSWNFFDSRGSEVETKLILNKGNRPVVERDWPETVDWNWWRLFFNPAGNDYHYSKQLELKAALLVQKNQSNPKQLLYLRAFRKYLDHVSESVGPDNFDTMDLNLKIKNLESGEFENLMTLKLPIAPKATS